MGRKHSQNRGAPHFPHDYPDCPAGARLQEEQEGEFLVKFKRSGGNGDLGVLNFTLINIIVRNTQNCFQLGHLVLPKLLCILKQHFGVLLVLQPTDKKQNLGWNIHIFTDGHVSTIFFNHLLANWKLHFKLWGGMFSVELGRDFFFFFVFFAYVGIK